MPAASPMSAATPQLAASKSAVAVANGAAAAQLAAELNVDVVTAQRILELQDQKKRVRCVGSYPEAIGRFENMLTVLEGGQAGTAWH